MYSLLLIRKTEDEKEIYNSIPMHQTSTKRTLVFGCSSGITDPLCTVEVDAEVFERVTVGLRYWIDIVEVLNGPPDLCVGLGPHTGRERRIMLHGGAGNILCRSCWAGELYHRTIGNLELGDDEKWDLPAWETATIFTRKR